MARALLLALAVLVGIAQGGARRHAREVLSEDPRIEYVENFVDAADMDALRGLARSLKLETVRDDTNETNGGEGVRVLSPALAQGHVAEGKAAGWQASSRFRAAAAEWAGLPAGSAVPVVSRWETWSASSNLNRSGALHLDARLRPHSHRTVLAYLSGAGEMEDGLTVFPCVETFDMEAKEVARREKICSRAFRHLKLAHEKLLKVHAEGMDLDPAEQFAFLSEHPELTALPKALPDGTRPVTWQWTAAHDAVAENAAGALKADPLWSLTESMCRGRAKGFSVKPKAGAAILLEAGSPARRGSGIVPDWRLWHAGCSPRTGRGMRWTVQLFLEGVRQKTREGGEATLDECDVTAQS